ncbi:YccF domain-containing protein [Olsenella uli]|uniref:YccF domain-containing protein n=1 Tax=Olsenella uli TaxID=133926 RepID=UPI0019582CC3|nr:YccF domain-containing protein [Olsenella uli]MBM6816190.1 YccF domain-containing protein [Olsenella uli]
MGCLSVVFNIIWILTGGWVTALGFLLAGVICSVTIVGIPLGRQAFKMAALTLAPFGKTIEYGGGAPSLVANVVWVLLGGWWSALCYLAEGAAFCVTVVGIPFGLQLFKMAKLALLPFGATVR